MHFKKFYILFVWTMMINSVLAQYHCVLKGNIKNIASNYIVLRHSGMYNLTYQEDTINLDVHGSFEFVWSLDEPTKMAYLSIADKLLIQIYGVIKDTVQLLVQDSAAGPVFRGRLAKANQYLQEQKRYWEKIFPTYLSRNPDFRQGEQDKTDHYYAILDSIYTDRILHAKSYYNKPAKWFEKKLVRQECENLLYENLMWKVYYNPDPDLLKFKFYQLHFDAPASFYYKFTDDASFNDPNILNNSYYLQFAQAFIRSVVSWKFKQEQLAYATGPFLDSAYAVIDKIAKNSLCNGVLKAYFINDGIQHFRDYTVDDSTVYIYGKYTTQLQQIPQVKKYAGIVSTRFAGFLRDREVSSLKQGLPAPDFRMMDSSGVEISLKDLRGKLIYIDAWASWCGPCIGSIPEWNAIVEKYKNDSNIVFITISLDKIRDQWIKALKRYKPGGKGYITADFGEFQSEFALKYKVDGIPLNILIDPQGMIIDARAKRPIAIDLSKYM